MTSRARGEWSESTTGTGVMGSLTTQADGSLSFSVSEADAAGLKGRVFTDQFADLTQCQATRQSGIGGLVVYSNAGVSGPVLALYWNGDEKIVVTYRVGASESLQSFAPGIMKPSQISLVRRGSMIYAYGVGATGVEPIVAVDFDFGQTPLVGLIALGDFVCSAPQVAATNATQSLTVEVKSGQPGTTLVGTWQNQNSLDSHNGSSLVNDGIDAAASATVRLNGLLAGSHDLWVRYSAGTGRTDTANVDVAGFVSPGEFALNQQMSGGIWIAVGRYQVAQTADVAISIKPGRVGSGTLSIDAVHYLWSDWTDSDHDGIPDAWEAVNGSNPLVADAQVDSVGAGVTNLDRFKGKYFASAGETPPGRAVFFVNPSGDDCNDGRSSQPIVKAWSKTKVGPKLTVGAALAAVGEASVVELHLDGGVAAPPGGFQNLNGIGVIIVPGVNGASLEAPQPTP